MKILIASEWYKPIPNGVVTSIVNLQRELIEMGHEVKILTMSRDFSSYESQNVYYMGSINVEKFYPNARQAVFSGLHFVRELIKWKPDVVHTQTEFSSFVYARRIIWATNAVHIHTYHTVYEDYTHYFSPSRRLGKVEIALFSNNILKKTDGIIVPTQKTKKILQSYKVKSKINVIPTGIDIEKFKKPIKENDRKLLRNNYGISEDDKVIIYVGRIAKEKNFEEIIKYIKPLNDIKLLVVGDGPYRNQIEKFVDDSNLRDRVIFTGMISPMEISSYYQLGDLFVSASNSETQGLTYIEALASGVPVLAKKDKCLEGVVEEGVNGWQFNDQNYFNEKINLFFKDKELRENMKKSAKEIAHQKFSSKNFAKKVLKVYEKSIKKKNKVIKLF